MGADTTLISVEVVYARMEHQIVVCVNVPVGSTVQQAIEASGLLQTFPGIDLNVNRVGVFSRLVGLDTVLQADDRVEIYRPLQVDPKESRRRRAMRSKNKS